MLFPTKTFQEPDKFLSQSSIQSLSSKFTLKGLSCSFPAVPASVNTTDIKKPSGFLAQSPSQNVRFSLATSHRPGPGRWSPSFNFPNTNLFCSWHPASTVQHAEAPSLPLQAHTWSLAAAPLNLGGWLPACPVTANQLWSGQACKLLPSRGLQPPLQQGLTPIEIPCPWVLACPYRLVPPRVRSLSSGAPDRLLLFCHNSELLAPLCGTWEAGSQPGPGQHCFIDCCKHWTPVGLTSLKLLYIELLLFKITGWFVSKLDPDWQVPI